MTRIIALLFLTAISFLSAFSQIASENDGYAASKFNMGLSYGHDWKQGVSDSYSTRISYQFLTTRHVSLIVGGRYVMSDASFTEADISHSHNPDAINMNGKHSLGQLSLTATFRAELFDIPLVGAAFVNSDWAVGGFAKVSSIVMAMVMIRADKDTQFGIGPLFLINTNGKIPALPAFMYRHRFNEKWLINLSGGLFAMEYSPSRKDNLSMGFDIGAKAFYFNPLTDDLPERLRYMSVSFRPMVKYSRNIVDNLNLDVRAGAAINIVNRVNGVNGTKKYIPCRQQRVYPFIQVGASYAF